MATYYISKINPVYENVYIILYENNKILLGETYKGFGNLGGKVKKDKTPLHSGVRELLEELFDWEDLIDRPRKQISNKLINTIVEEFLGNQQVIVYKQKENIFILMSIQILNQILSFIYQNYPNLQSSYYPVIPKDVSELTQNRFPGLRGFNYSGIHSNYYNYVQNMFMKMDPNKSIEDHLKKMSKHMGKKSVLRKIRGKIQQMEVYHKPESVLFAMYSLKTFDLDKLKHFLDKNIRDPDLHMEIRSFAWVHLNQPLKDEDKKLVRYYGVGLASYVSEDIELFKMIMNDQAQLLTNPKKDGMMFVLSS